MKKFLVSVLVAFFAVYTISAQNKSFNLNDASGGSMKSKSILEKTSTQTFQNASKSRELVINPVIQRKELIHVNDTIILGLFSDKQYKACVDKIDEDVNGTTTIRARILDSNYGYCIISTFNGKSFMTVEVPNKNELYMSKYDQKTKKYYLLQIDKTKQKALEGAPSLIPPTNNQPNNNQPNNNLPTNKPKTINSPSNNQSTNKPLNNNLPTNYLPTNNPPKNKLQAINPSTSNLPSNYLSPNYSTTNIPQYSSTTNQLPTTKIESKTIAKSRSIVSDPNTVDTITLMIVYTPAAAAWSTANETNINNTISLLMTKAQLALDNSNTLMTLKLVFTAQVDYTELNNENDLYNLTAAGDGLMEDVHPLRDAYCADLVVLLEDMDFKGGIGWQLISNSGSPDHAFSITRVQQASWTYSTIHEIGHNLGCHHPKTQNLEPGPGLYSYSAGWRWNGTDGIKYCDVMTYESGQDFADGINATRVPYFSNPDIQYQGVPTGDAVEGDNARTIREMKSVISAYRSNCRNCTPPTTQATAFTSSEITDNSITIGWTRGNGTSVLVVARRVNAVLDLPINEIAYAASPTFGSGTQIGTGNYVVYDGTGTSVNITALRSGTSYDFDIYEYNSTSKCYLKPALAGTAKTTGVPPSPSNLPWTWQNPLPQGNGLRCVKFIDANVGYAIGSAGTIIKTINGGIDWEILNSGTLQMLNSVYFVDANIGYAVGYNVILKTTNGGADWTIQNSGSSYIELFSVWFTDENTGYIVGGDGKILKTTNGGVNWIVQPSGANVWLTSVYFTDANTGYALGGNLINGVILKTTNGGNDWTIQYSDNPSVSMFWSVYFSDNNNGYATGWDDKQKGIILKTINGGIDWTVQSVGSLTQIYSSYWIDSNIGFTAGADDKQQVLILKTTNGGIDWTSQPIKLYPPRSIYFPNANVGYIVGELGTIFKTINGGTDWASQTIGTTKNLKSVCFVDDKTGYAAGDALLKTTNGGETWINQAYPLYEGYSLFAGINSVYFTDANTGYAVGGQACPAPTAKILKTTNGGIDWSTQSFSSVNYYFFNSVYFTDANTGYVVGGRGHIYKTTNRGIDWKEQSSGTTNALNSVHFIDSNIGYTVGYEGTIFKTTNGGINWVSQTSGTSDNLTSVRFLDANIGFAVGSMGLPYGQGNIGIVLKTTNGGAEWKTILTLGNCIDFHSINLIDSNIVYLVGKDCSYSMGGVGILMKTINGGTDWTKITLGAENYLYSASFTDANTGYIVGDGGTILKITNGGVVNSSPVANAGSDQSVSERSTVTLDGSSSSDLKGNPLTYKWTAPAGITLSSTTAVKPTFRAPNVSAKTDYKFWLEVNNGYVDSPADDVNITVNIDNSGILLQDSLALVALYNATDGSNWTKKRNWLTGQVGSWEGVTVEGSRVVKLELIGFPGFPGLKGTLPSELSNLTALRELNLSQNKLSGSLPNSLSALVNLQLLNLFSNQFSGVLPESWSSLVNLRFLELSSNKLSGTIPENWMAMVNLQQLYLCYNQLTGLPNLLTLTNLNKLSVEGNLLDFGDIEPNIGVPKETFSYSPQTLIGVPSIVSKNKGQEFKVSVIVGGSSNIYQWYKNGELIQGATATEFVIPSISTDAAGDYTCQITNSVATELTLTSQPITLQVLNDINSVSEILGKDGIIVYPNPSKGVFKIEGLKANQKNKITVYTLDSKLLIKKISNLPTESIDISDQVSGTYLLFINNQSFKIRKE